MIKTPLKITLSRIQSIIILSYEFGNRIFWITEFSGVQNLMLVVTLLIFHRVYEISDHDTYIMVILVFCKSP